VSSCSLASSSVSCCKPQKSQEKNPLDCVGMGLGDLGGAGFADRVYVGVSVMVVQL
jgi:hypothetical protein